MSFYKIFVVLVLLMGINTLYAQTGITITTVNANPACSGGTSGSIQATAKGGVGPYQYQLSEVGAGGWQSGNTFSGLKAGTYPVSTRDANGNFKTVYVTLTDPTPVTATVLPSPASCAGSADGAVTVQAAGGNGTYSYAWSLNNTAVTSANAAGLKVAGYTTSRVTGPAGTYTVTVTDGLGCAGPVTYYNPDVISLNINSFNQDVIVESTATAATIASGAVTSKLDNDAIGNVFYETGFKSQQNGLPAAATRIITSAQDNSVTYLLQPYNQVNSNRTLSAGTSTLTLATPTSLAKLLLLGTSGNGQSVYSYAITFDDGTTYAGTAANNQVSFRDWFATNGPDVSMVNLARIALGSSTKDVTNFAIYEAPIAIPPAYYTKKVQSIKLTNISTSSTAAGNIFALSGLRATGSSSTVGYAAPNISSPTVSISSSLDAMTNQYCSGQSITYSASTVHGGTAPTYKWEYSTDSTSWATAASTTSTYTTGSITTAKYYVRSTATASSDANCLASSTSATVVFSATMNTNLTPTVSIVGAGTACQGSPINFSVSGYSNAGSTPPAINWKDNTTNQSLGSGTTLTTSSLAVGSYNVVAVITNSVCGNKQGTSNVIPLTVSPSPAPTVSIVNLNSAPPIIFALSDSSNLGKTPSYQWYLNGTAISGATSAKYTAAGSSSGTNSYSLKVTSSLTCASPTMAMSNYRTIATALPIVLQYFTPTPYADKVSVDWKTSLEVNTDKFEILRKYQDSSDFKVIATVKATNQPTGSTYQIFDYPVLAGNYLYQLKNYDFDGSFSLSDVKSVYFGGQSSFRSSVFPNPFIDHISVVLNNAKAEDGVIQLINMAGTIVASRSIALVNGVGNYNLNGLGTLPSGVYICRIMNTKGSMLTSLSLLKK